MEWISVKDRLPDPDIDVLCYSLHIHFWFHDRTWNQMGIGVKNDYDNKFRMNDDDTTWIEVTHWMPLPEPPEKRVETDWEYFRYHTLAARATLYPGKSFDEVNKIVDDMIKKSEDSTDVN